MKHQARKRFGQNFLQDKNIIHNIVNSLHLQATDNVLEIGPGQGALTFEIAPLVASLDALEIDRDLYQALSQQAPANLNVHLQDALKCSLQDYVTSSEQALRIVGNLPYNISTPLIFHLLQQVPYIKDMHFMLQKEVVQRMAASVNTPEYGRLSVMVQYLCRVENLLLVPPTAFYPQPKVDSAIVRLTPHQTPIYPPCDPKLLADVVTRAFNQRRKTIRNSLKDRVNDQQITQCGLDPQLRAQQLTVANFVEIATMIK